MNQNEAEPRPGRRPLCAQCERPCRVCWCDALPRPRISIATRVADPDPYPDWIRIQSGQWIRIRIQEGKNAPQK